MRLSDQELVTIETALDAMALILPEGYCHKERAMYLRAIQIVREKPKEQRRIRSDHNTKRLATGEADQVGLPEVEALR